MELKITHGFILFGGGGRRPQAPPPPTSTPVIFTYVQTYSHIHTVGHKDRIIYFEIKFLSVLLFFFFFFFFLFWGEGSFITLEQFNDYVMILEYQGKINMQNLALRYMPFLFGAIEGQMCNILSVLLFLAYVQ